MMPILTLLAQMNSSKFSDGMPGLDQTDTYGMTWIVAAVITVAILLVTFKTSKRNALDRD
jgi:hypothetical protein